MGCDIHMWIEVQRDDGTWLLVASGTEERDYALFGRLAWVRREDEKPIAEPRGIPSDASEGYLYHCKRWEDDGHTHSWLLLSELMAVNLNCMFVWRMQGLVEPFDRTRAVFFFDN